jgi:hypothetical protein
MSSFVEVLGTPFTSDTFSAVFKPSIPTHAFCAVSYSFHHAELTIGGGFQPLLHLLSNFILQQFAACWCTKSGCLPLDMWSTSASSDM